MSFVTDPHTPKISCATAKLSFAGGLVGCAAASVALSRPHKTTAAHTKKLSPRFRTLLLNLCIEIFTTRFTCIKHQTGITPIFSHKFFQPVNPLSTLNHPLPITAAAAST